MKRDFKRYPKYKELYIRAFEKMIENHPGMIRTAEGIPIENVGGAENSSTVGRDGVALENRRVASLRIMDWWLNWNSGMKGF